MYGNVPQAANKMHTFGGQIPYWDASACPAASMGIVRKRLQQCEGTSAAAGACYGTACPEKAIGLSLEADLLLPDLASQEIHLHCATLLLRRHPSLRRHQSLDRLNSLLCSDVLSKASLPLYAIASARSFSRQ